MKRKACTSNSIWLLPQPCRVTREQYYTVPQMGKLRLREETRESFPLPLGRTGNGSHEATQYKKNISFISALDFMLLWRVSYVCANKLCGLMWTMHLRNNVCDDVSMPRCDSCHALVPADLAFTPPWALGNSCQLCSWSKTLGKERTGK